MTGRASGFGNPRVIKMLNDSFVPVAIDINLVKHKKDAEGEFFRYIAEQGHYAGRTKPTATRQGLYATGIDGDLLHSLNTTRHDQMIALMSRALAKWDKKQGKQSRKKLFREDNSPDKRFEVGFPENGLILRETMRDLPRAEIYKQPTEKHNFDHVWLTAKEKQQFIPKKFGVGHKWEISETTVQRIAEFHTVDQVRGEADAWNRKDVEEASLEAEVVSVDGDDVTIKLTGKIKCRKPGSGQTNPYNKRKVNRDIANDLSVRGWLIFDRTSRSFDSFKMLAAGMRTGADVYNFRWKDLGPSPIGFAFELLEDAPANRIRPKFLFWKYFSNEIR